MLLMYYTQIKLACLNKSGSIDDVAQYLLEQVMTLILASSHLLQCYECVTACITSLSTAFTTHSYTLNITLSRGILPSHSTYSTTFLDISFAYNTCFQLFLCNFGVANATPVQIQGCSGEMQGHEQGKSMRDKVEVGSVEAV